MTSLAIVGSGITGALTAFMVKQVLPHVKVVVLEKASGVGGRMCTSHSPLSDQCTADLGAQYFSVTSNTSETAKRYYKELVDENLLQPLNVTIEGMRPKEQKQTHYVCGKGSGSVVRYFINKSGCQTYFSERVTEVFLSAENGNWMVKTEKLVRDGFNGVILTIPIPQVLQIQGIPNLLTDEQKSNMEKVTYNSRLAMALFYEKTADFINITPWGIKYVADNPVIRYLSIDNKKRNKPTELPAVIIHTTKEFGKSHIDGDVSKIQELILRNARELIPNLPEPSSVKFHKWRYSQIENPYLGKPGFIILKNLPLLICGGDGFRSSTFDECLYSAEKIVDAIVKSKTFKI